MTRQQRLKLLAQFNQGLESAEDVKTLVGVAPATLTHRPAQTRRLAPPLTVHRQMDAYEPLNEGLSGLSMRKFRGVLEDQTKKIRGKLKRLDMFIKVGVASKAELPFRDDAQKVFRQVHSCCDRRAPHLGQSCALAPLDRLACGHIASHPGVHARGRGSGLMGG